MLSSPFRPLLRGALIAICLLMAAFASSAAQSFRTQTFTELEGVPGTELWDLASAADGSLAVATRVGVGLYDGSGWERQGTSEGFPLPNGCSLLEYDERGRLWCVGTLLANGLAVLERDAWRRVPLTIPCPPKDWASDLGVLHVAGQTLIAVVAASGGLFLYEDPGWRRVEHRERGALQDTPLERVHALEVCGESLLLVRDGALLGLDFGASSSREWTAAELPAGELLGVHLEAGEGYERLWMVSTEWLGYLEEGRFTKAVEKRGDWPFHSGFHVSMVEDGLGGLYAGVTTTLVHYSAGTQRLRPLGLTEGLITEGCTDLVLDHEGGLCVASLRGLSRIPRQAFDSFDTRQGLLQDEVTAILELVPGELTFGHALGFSRFDGGPHPRTYALPVPRDLDVNRVRVLDLQAGRDGACWAATSRLGVERLNADGSLDSFGSPDGSLVHSVAMDSRGRCWVGADGGLYSLEPSSGEFQGVASLSGTPIRRVYSSASGRLYAGGMKDGLFVWDSSDEVHTSAPQSFTHPQLPSANNVYAALELRSGRVLVATRAGVFALGAQALQRAPEFSHVTASSFSLLEDSRGGLWAGTGRGVYSWRAGERRHYGVFDGLAGQESNRAALFEDSRGRIWIGTDGGVSRYDEARDLALEPLKIVEVVESVGGVPLERLELPSHSDLEFEYKLVHLDSSGTEVRARLLGYDEAWGPARPMRERVLRYTNLPAGEYTLELQARRHAGEWGPSAFSRQIVVERPIYERLWFIALCLAALITLAAGVATLVTTRRNAASLAAQVRERGEALAESERRYRAMFTRTSAIQLVLDPATWRVIDANPAACMFFDSSLSRLVGSPLSELTGVGIEPLAAQAAKLEEGAGELVLRPAPDQAGSFSSVELRLCQYRLRGKRVIQVTVNDITTRLELEQNLREAQKLRAVGELASGIAHDFNNLLAVILGFSELISYEFEQEHAIQEHLNGINEAAEKGADLVRQLLAFGRRQHLELEQLELSPLVGDFVDILRRLLDRRIEIVADLDPLAGHVRADRNSLERVLMNLALNARDAMPEGGRLTLSTRGGLSDDSETGTNEGAQLVCLSVEDTGSGMDEEVRTRMFEPFYTTKSVGKGTGLGLSTVHGIVGQSGGRIRVTSVPGEGTRIELYFPMLDPRATSKGEQGESSSNALQRAGQDRSPLRVLLVDDEPGVRHLVATLLRSLGHSALEADCGEAALAALRSSSAPIDLLLTDVRMPGLSGPELAERAHELAPQMQVLFMSGFTEQMESCDGEPLLSKPFSVTQLASAISEARLRRVAQEEG